MKYESTFKAIDQILWNEAGCGGELDYIEQTSWLLFLKYLDDLEQLRDMEAQMEGKTYTRILSGFYRWSAWAAPKTATGELDKVNAMTGDELVEFVNQKLFPHLRTFKDKATATNTIEYKIGEIFGELRNKIYSGSNMRDIINKIDTLRFQSAEDIHEMTVLYEDKIKRMGNAGRNGGEYYTPRPLIRSIIRQVNPQIGETVYDPACGSAGFLCEAYNYMLEQVHKGSVSDFRTLQDKTFTGKEKKPLPYIIATMNMIFHGVTAPNIIRTNTLSENLSGVQRKDQFDVILANPPFGGNERAEVLQNFEIRSSETAYMFMQHIVKMLRAGGRAGIVIKNTFLSNGDAAEVRRMLLEQCNLHTILDLPAKVFTAGVRTVVLFFTKGEQTKRIFYYQLDPGRSLGKTQALNADDMAEFTELAKHPKETEHSWFVDVKDIDKTTYDLSVKNPNQKEIVDERTTTDILNALSELNEDSIRLVNEIIELL